MPTFLVRFGAVLLTLGLAGQGIALFFEWSASHPAPKPPVARQIRYVGPRGEVLPVRPDFSSKVPAQAANKERAETIRGMSTYAVIWGPIALLVGLVWRYRERQNQEPLPHGHAVAALPEYDESRVVNSQSSLEADE